MLVTRRSVVQGGVIGLGAIAVGGFPRSSLATTRLNVADFGASGGGVIDDFEAISSAVAEALRTGASVYFPSGTYLVSEPIVIDDVASVAIEGDGWEDSALVTDASSALEIGGSVGVGQVSLSGVAVYSAADADESTLVGERGVRIGSISALTVESCAFGDVEGNVDVSILGTVGVSIG